MRLILAAGLTAMVRKVLVFGVEPVDAMMMGLVVGIDCSVNCNNSGVHKIWTNNEINSLKAGVAKSGQIRDLTCLNSQANLSD